MGQGATAVGEGSTFGVYVHYPLCRRRCGYCDFPVIEHASFPHEAYAASVLQEVCGRAPAYRAMRLRSIYFGGGTPSLWPTRQIARVIDAVLGAFTTAPEVEITLEANPGTLDGSSLRELRAAGVNRLSLGVQSLDDALLRRLTRDHGAAQAREAIVAARQAGFDNLSCDLMFGLADHAVGEHVAALRELVAHEPEHVSLYALTLSRGSALWRSGERPADDDRMAQMLEEGRALLEEHGYAQYEVSNFSRPGYRSVHNGLVWRGRPYLGLGAAAHSMFVAADTHTRQVNPPFSRYLGAEVKAGPPPAVEGSRVWRLDSETSRFEMMMLGLRTTDGVVRPDYAQRFGADPMAHFGHGLECLARDELVHITDDRIAPTPRGIWFADELAIRL